MGLGSRSWFLVGFAVVLLAAATPADAAAAWQPPFTLSAPGQEATLPELAIDRRGNALVVWQRGDRPARGIYAAARPAGAAFGAPLEISGRGGAPDVGFDSRGEAIAVWHRHGPSPGPCPLCVEASFRPAGGLFGLPERVPATGAQPQLAVGPRGEALVLVRHPGGIAKPIRASFRPAGGRFGGERKLGGGQTGTPRVAFDARGRAVAVWSRGVRILSAFRPRRGGFRGPHDVSGGDLPRLAVDRRGNALAVWRRGVFPKARVRVAFRPAGRRFGRARTLSGPDAGDETDVAFDRRGNALAVWWRRSPNGRNFRVQAAFRPAGSRFRKPRTIARVRRRVAEPRVAFDRRSNALVAWWAELNRNRGTWVQAAYRPAGRRFRKPRTVSRRAEGVGEIRLAFDRRGNALAVWEDLELEGFIAPTGSRIRAAVFHRRLLR